MKQFHLIFFCSILFLAFHLDAQVIATTNSLESQVEQTFRQQIENPSAGIKLVSLAQTEKKEFETAGTERFRVNFKAVIAFEMDASLPPGVPVHQGDRATFAGWVSGAKGETGWVFKIEEMTPSDASNPTLLSQLKGSKAIAERNACINYLRQIDGSKQQWALENKLDSMATPTMPDVRPYLHNPDRVKCPSGGTYTLRVVKDYPQCSTEGHTLETDARGIPKLVSPNEPRLNETPPVKTTELPDARFAEKFSVSLKDGTVIVGYLQAKQVHIL